MADAHRRPGGLAFAAVPAPFGPLIDTDWLRHHLGEPGLVVVDCRFVLGQPGAGERAWRAGHLPGAAVLDVDRDLAGEQGERGRYPLPEPADFEAAARRAGIGGKSRVVAYDEAGEGGAARLWWLLRHFGHDDVAVLDGGLRAWRAAGGPMRAGPERIEPGDFTAQSRDGDTVSADDVLRAEPMLLDARASERFRGEVEPIDSVAGHIPGAKNVPFAELAPEGRFPPPAELRDRLGGEPFVAYCGSGITACTLLVAAELAGLEARLYPGSWSEWSRRGLPVETGP
jgi:thiosulfate/3-mercaptopyruvate sulfurtransferase